MIQSEIKKLIRKMRSVYQGDPWYGQSITKVLQAVGPEKVFDKPLPRAHSIAEIVAHMVSWRELLSYRLQDDASFSVTQNESFNWKRFDPNPETAWDSLLKRLDENQKEIIDLLENAEDTLLTQKVAKRNYSYRSLIRGIIEHDVYHQGQIVLLGKGGV